MPAVVGAVKEAVEHFTHTCFMVTPYEGYVAVAEQLNRLTPGSHEKRTVLFNSGAEAVENAVKVARLATGRDAVVAFDHAYHGRTNLTMALTAKAMPYKSGPAGSFGPFAPEVYRLPMSYPYREENPDLTGAEAAQRTGTARVQVLVHVAAGAHVPLVPAGLPVLKTLDVRENGGRLVRAEALLRAERGQFGQGGVLELVET